MRVLVPFGSKFLKGELHSFVFNGVRVKGVILLPSGKFILEDYDKIKVEKD